VRSTIEKGISTVSSYKRESARRLAALGAAIGVGLIGRRASDAVGRNPGVSAKIMIQSILSTAKDWPEKQLSPALTTELKSAADQFKGSWI